MKIFRGAYVNMKISSTLQICRRNLRAWQKLKKKKFGITAMLACSSSCTLFAPKVNYSCRLEKIYSRKKLTVFCCTAQNIETGREQNNFPLNQESNLRRRLMLLVSVSTGLFPALAAFGKTKGTSPFDERRLLEQNKRIQRENNVPEDFPNFVREGFDVKVVTPDNYITSASGLVYRDIQVGQGDCPKDGQQVTFHYVGYNESGRRIDSTYLQGTPAKIRLGTNALVPGFEEGIRDMRPGGKRRIIIPPELGPPVGPSTFFSSKQFEVFDVELLSIQSCERRTIVGFYSDVVCN